MKKILLGAMIGSAITAAAAYTLHVVRKKKRAVEEAPEYVGSNESHYSNADLAAEHFDGEALPPAKESFVKEPKMLDDLTISTGDMLITLSASSGLRSVYVDGKQTGANMSAWWPQEEKGYLIEAVKADNDEHDNGIFYWLMFTEQDSSEPSKFFWSEMPENKTKYSRPKYVVALNAKLEVVEIVTKDPYSSKQKLRFGLFGVDPVVQLTRFDGAAAPTICRMAFYGDNKTAGIIVYDALNGKAKTLDYKREDLIGYVFDKITNYKFEIVALYEAGEYYVYQTLGDPSSSYRPKYCKDIASSYNPRRFMEACEANDGKIPDEYYEIMPYYWSPAAKEDS